jgi:hypothetical protein
MSHSFQYQKRRPVCQLKHFNKPLPAHPRQLRSNKVLFQGFSSLSLIPKAKHRTSVRGFCFGAESLKLQLSLSIFKSMLSTTESGYAKVVSGFETFVQRCQQFGTAYNPSNASIQLAALNTLLTNARAAILAVNTAKNNLNLAVNARKVAFSNLPKLAGRIVNALMSSAPAQPTIDNARFFLAKINGRRIGARPNTERVAAPVAPAEPLPGPGSTPATGGIGRSVSQVGFDARLDNFSKLVLLVSSEPAYAPNETDLQVASLNALVTDLQGKNSAVIIANTTWTNARLQRETVIHDALSGLVSVTRKAKKYIRSVFGASSLQYKQVSHILIR